MSVLPTWLALGLAAGMLGLAACGAARLAAATVTVRPVPWDLELCHLLMAVAMAGMLATGLATLPSWLWAAVFAGYGLWFAARRRAGHLLLAVAMVYMLVCLRQMPPMAAADLICGGQMLGMTAAGGSAPAAAVVLGGLSFGDAALVAGRLAAATALAPVPAGGLPATAGAATRVRPSAVDRLLDVRTAAASHLVMAVTMGVMLVTMR